MRQRKMSYQFKKSLKEARSNQEDKDRNDSQARR